MLAPAESPFMSPRRRSAVRRLDERLVQDGLAETVAQAQSLVLAGRVVVGDHRCDKAGTPVRDDQQVRLAGAPAGRYVSRGGDKLDGALRDLGVAVSGLRCLDLGASTGGFTDCLLQHGAAEVVALDVAYGMLHDKLRKDARVHVRERTHVRALHEARLPYAAELAVMDLSFIGARTILPMLLPHLHPTARVLVLVKPQFEIDKDRVGEGGVVRDEADRVAAVDLVARAAAAVGLREVARADCRLPGPAGNREVFLLLERTPGHGSGPDPRGC
jgi:23S rRNA (cytidine1920-2'-O)/16S rRNA (cytidine1409-2'-O)-methyltransferase